MEHFRFENFFQDSLKTGNNVSLLQLRGLETIKIRELRRIFGCSFRCNAGRIVSYVTGITTETTAKKTSKACILIFSKSLRAAETINYPILLVFLRSFRVVARVT